MASEWRVDDPAIPDMALVHRRLTGNGSLVRDAITGAFVLGVNAYRYNDSDGMSVYVSTLMSVQGITDLDLIDWTSEQLARVSVAIVRRSEAGKTFSSKVPPVGTVPPGQSRETRGGVVAEEATEHPPDIRVRRSHGLVRMEARPPAKVLWNAFRNKLLQNSEVKTGRSEVWRPAA